MGRKGEKNMKKVLKLMLALVMTCAIAGCSSSSKNDADVTITIGTSPDYAPYESLNKKGEIVGFDVDMAKLFEGYLSDMEGKTYSLEFKQMDFDNIVTQIQGDQIDLGISGFTYSEDRVVEWSDPYLGTQQVAVVPNGSSITSNDQLVGKKAGEEVEVNVTFPETYHAENLAGKPVVFNVKVNDVKVKEVPALDDEFAKDTTEFETLAELRADVKAKLEEQAKNAADAEMRNALVEKVSANTEVEVPEAMVQHQIDNMLMELNYQLQYQGLNLEQLLQMTGRGLDELREERRADAERLVKSSLVLEAIAEKENVEANDADVDDELEKMAAMYNMEVEKIKSSLRETDIEDIKGQIKIRKTLDLLVENATIA